MNNKVLGIVVGVLGLLLTCCLCPLVLNSVVFLATAGQKTPTSIYGNVFSQRIGNILASNYVSAGQLICTDTLALIVLIVGVVMLVQAMRSKG